MSQPTKVVILCWDDLEDVLSFDTEDLAHAFIRGLAYADKSGFYGYSAAPAELEILREEEPNTYETVASALGL